jgi:hypothetical protein
LILFCCGAQFGKGKAKQTVRTRVPWLGAQPPLKTRQKPWGARARQSRPCSCWPI